MSHDLATNQLRQNVLGAKCIDSLNKTCGLETDNEPMTVSSLKLNQAVCLTRTRTALALTIHNENIDNDLELSTIDLVKI